MAKQGIHIVVGATYTDRDLKRAQADLNRLGVAAKRAQTPMGQMSAGLQKKLTPNFMAMGAAVAAAGATIAAFAIQLGVKGVQAAAEEEQAVARLNQALESVGQGFRLAEVEAFVDALQRSSGVADDELRPALQTLVTATGDVAQSQELLNLALDVSVGTQKDLTAVSGALAKATNGQFTQINRLTNGALNPSILATKDLSLITKELSRLYGGQAQANAETFAGSMARLQIAADELLESFGAGFIDAFEEGGDTAGEMGDSLKAAEPGMRAFGESIGELARLLAIAAPAFSMFVDTLKYALPSALGATAAAFPPLAPVVAMIGGLFASGAKAASDYADAAEIVGVRFSGPMSAGAQTAQARLQDMAGTTEDAEDALSDLNDEMKEFFGFMDQRDAVRGYQKAIDDFRRSLKENGKTFDDNTEAGRNNQEALDGIYESALDVAEGQATAAEKVATMEQASRDAAKQLDKTKMSESAKQELLQPFDDAIARFDASTTKVANLKQEMEKLPTTPINIDINVNTNYTSSGVPGPYAGKKVPRSSGGLITGAGTSTSDSIPVAASNGEFMVRASMVDRIGIGALTALNSGRMPQQWYRPGPSSATSDKATAAGVTFGDIIVQGAPAEAVESLPRRLRHEMYLAGL